MSTTFFLDTGVLEALLKSPSTHPAKVAAVERFVASQRSKAASLVCPAIVRIELHKHLYRQTAGNPAKVSEERMKLADAGVITQKTFTADVAAQSIFDSAMVNVGECNMSLGDAFIASETALSKAVLVTFDESDFVKCSKHQKLKWYNPDSLRASSPEVRKAV